METLSETVPVWFPDFAKMLNVRVTSETAAVLRTLYRRDGVYYAGRKSAANALLPWVQYK